MLDDATGGEAAMVAMNVLLGALVGGCAVAVAVAVIRDLADRRRMRGPMPDAWPPAEQGEGRQP